MQITIATCGEPCLQAERASGSIDRPAGTSGGGVNSPASISAIAFSVSPMMWRA
jgi:hypothetical protein